MNAPVITRPKRHHFYCGFCHNNWATDTGTADVCPSCEKATVREIMVHFEFPPIPIREYDFCAYFDGEEESHRYRWGPTSTAAINDLISEYGGE